MSLRLSESCSWVQLAKIGKIWEEFRNVKRLLRTNLANTKEISGQSFPLLKGFFGTVSPFR